MKDTGQRRKEYDFEHPQEGDVHTVYDSSGVELGYAVALDEGFGLQWDVYVLSPRGVPMGLGVEDTREDADMAVREWFDDV